MCRRYYYAAAALLSLLLFPILVCAQDDKDSYQEWKKRMQREYDNYKRQQKEEYESFRQKANAEYAEFVRKHWEEMQAIKGIKPPEPKPVPPVVVPEEDIEKERKDEPKPFEEVIVIEPPKPQPQPVEPVKPVEPVVPVAPKPITVSTAFFGTQIECQMSAKPQFNLANISDDAIGDAWEQLSNGQCDGLLAQCLELRSRHKLNDWGYILLLDSISQTVIHPGLTATPLERRRATLLMAWLYCQSGYRMRLARSNGQLYMLYASENIIYDVNYFTIGGYRYYPYRGEKLETLNVCPATFPKEQTMTLKIALEPQLANNTSGIRTLQSRRYPNIKVTTVVNRNLIDFYDKYPNGAITADFGNRWAMYANAPLSEKAKQTLYPQLRNLLAGKSKLQAAEELLNLVQTALVYEYDDTVWGEDRAFFAEESLYYPYADCEDRSILFSRLVRDVLGLKVVLLYYPNHLATAIHFDGEQPTGDYLELEDGRYYIADPTITGYGAPIGVSMPQVRDEKIKVIVL